MALGDKVVVTLDESGRAPGVEEMRADSAGGSVAWRTEGAFIIVEELSRSKRPIRTAAFASARVISVVEHPKGR